MINNILIYGINPVLKVLEKRANDILTIYIFNKEANKKDFELDLKSKNFYNKDIKKIINNAKLNNIEVEFIDEKNLSFLLKELNLKNKISFQKVFARIKQKQEISINNLIKYSNTCLIVDGITDSNNLGAIIRNMASFNIDTLIIPKHNSVKIDSTVYKTSVGEIENINYCYVTNLTDLIKKLKTNGFWTYGFENEGSNIIWDIDFSLKSCFVLGGEASGISYLLKKNLDFIVKIPIEVNSLNVASSSAIVLYEYNKNLKCK
jgi:23S rRNA (guanosine2251-2'-O)-methyltransferase